MKKILFSLCSLLLLQGSLIAKQKPAEPAPQDKTTQLAPLVPLYKCSPVQGDDKTAVPQDAPKFVYVLADIDGLVKNRASIEAALLLISPPADEEGDLLPYLGRGFSLVMSQDQKTVRLRGKLEAGGKADIDVTLNNQVKHQTVKVHFLEADYTLSCLTTMD